MRDKKDKKIEKRLIEESKERRGEAHTQRERIKPNTRKSGKKQPKKEE